MKTARLILGDQLNLQHSWFTENDPEVLYIMMELHQEAEYVKHHIQKLLAFFAAMRSFAETLRDRGHVVLYINISDKKSSFSLAKNLTEIFSEKNIRKFEYQLPDEYRLDHQLSAFCQQTEVDTAVFDTEHFLTGRDDLADFFENKKTYRMENFYRMMRRKYNILIKDDEPEGGQWNFDRENRQPYDEAVPAPDPLLFKNDVQEIFKEIEQAGIAFFGKVDTSSFPWPVNRRQSLQLLNHFINTLLPRFGTYQDAMTVKSGTLFHSRLSFALNSKMLHPMEVIDRVIQEWKSRSDEISLSQVEGYVRQILGWREYMRGIYWARMPKYEKLNFFDHGVKLPDFYWSGRTRMNCMKHTIGQSLRTAYAHHIQRLMITGNFALLAGIDPGQVDAWYLGIYIDAVQWVEITNTRGMSQYADGGIVGTKPYVSSANYIRKMSDYCDDCFYNSDRKYGEKSCPFNSLYWDFYNRHREKLQGNPRTGMMFRTLDRMDPETRKNILEQAKQYRENIENL